MAKKRKTKKRKAKKRVAKKAKRRVKTKRRAVKSQPGVIGAIEEAASLRQRLAGHNTFED